MFCLLAYGKHENVTGAMPASWPANLKLLDLSTNNFGRDDTPSLEGVAVECPSCVLLVLANNSFSGSLNCHLDGQLSVLDLTSTGFLCPLPELTASSVMIGGECRHDVVQILMYGGVLAGAVGVLGLVYVVSLRQRSRAFRLARFGALFAFGVVDLVSDIRLNVKMLEYVSGRPMCGVFTDKSFFEDIMLTTYIHNNEPWPTPDSFSTFAEYVTQVEQAFAAPALNINFIKGLCSRVQSNAAPLCRFSDERYVCENTTAELPFAYFRKWVIVVLVLYGIKEFAKVAAVACLCIRNRSASCSRCCSCCVSAASSDAFLILKRSHPENTDSEREGAEEETGRPGLDSRLGVFVSKSVLAPCLVAVLGVKGFEELVLGDATEMDTWLELLYEVKRNMAGIFLDLCFFLF